MSTTPLTNITNPPRCPLEDPIATVASREEDPASKVSSPLDRQRQAGGGGGDAGIQEMLGGTARRHPGKLREIGAKVTLPWLRWFNFIDVKVVQATEPILSNDPWVFDFSSEDFWSNVAGPGANPPASWEIVVSEDQHPGIQRLRTDVNNGDITTAFIPVAANGGLVRWDAFAVGELVFKTPPTITSCRFEAALSSNPASNWPATTFQSELDMMSLFYDTAVDNALRFTLRVGGVLTTSLVLIDPCPTDLWIEVIFQRRLVGADYVLDVTVNGSLKTTVTTGLFSDSTAFGGTFKIGTRTGAARDLFVDRASFPPKPPTHRWDTTI